MSIEMISVVCPVCGDAPAEELYQQRDLLTGRNPELFFRLVRCASCGLVRQSPRPADLARFYADYPVHTGGLRPNWVIWLDRLWHWPAKQRLRRLLGKEAMILDIGCGTGANTRFLRSNPDWHYTGLEPSPAAVAVARATGLHVVQGGIGSLGQMTQKFDLVFMNHVFEHLDQPVAALRAIAPHLTSRGIVQIVAPNLVSWEHAFFREHWINLDLPRHLWVFSPETLSKVAHRAGYNALSIRHSPRPSGWIGSIHFLCRSRGREHSLPPWLQRPLLIAAVPLAALAAWFGRAGTIVVTLRPAPRTPPA